MGLNIPQKKRPGIVRETFKHAAVYSGAGALGRLIGFFMLPFYAHILRDIGYGVIGMIDASITLLASLFAYNFHSAILRIYHEEPDPTRKPAVATTGTILVVGIVVTLAFIGSIFSRPISDLLLGTPGYWHLICLALASFSLDMVGQTSQTILVIRRRSGIYSLIGLMRLIIGVGMNILLVVVLRWGLLGFFLSHLIVSLASLVISLVLLIRFCGLGFDREIARRLLAFQLPLIPGSIASFFSRQIERVIVRYQLSLSTVGVLEIGYKFPSLISLLIVGPFLKSWGTQRLEIADHPQAPERIGKVFSYFLYLCLLGGLLLTVNIRTVLQLLTPPEFWEAFSVARVQTMQVIVHGIGLHLTFGLIYAKRTDIMARLAIFTAAIKVGLAYLMISTWGLYGAAWSSFAAATIYTVWGFFLARSYYRFLMEWRKLAFMTGFAVALFLYIDTIETESIAAWGAPFLEATKDWMQGLNDTWLGRWRDGRLLNIMFDRSDLVFDLCIRSLLVSIYLLILPLVHTETKRSLGQRLARLRARGTPPR
jgi:O-antigen/teichoic acid export membrane protein